MHGLPRIVVAGGLLLLTAPAVQAADEPLPVCEIQSNTFDGDMSWYDLLTVDCLGGVVVGKFAGFRDRIILWDPEPDLACSGVWRGIQVKDWNGGLFDNVVLGDYIRIYDVFVEEFRGTTLLQWQSITPAPSYELIGAGIPIPPPVRVSVADMPAPIYDSAADGWFVAHHDAEPFESMLLAIRDVTVMERGHGKAADNYVLQDSEGHTCWAADYMNVDKEPWEIYHEWVTVGQHFCAVTGVFEQYMDPYLDEWDYYQLITVKGVDLAICADGDRDKMVTLGDLPRFDECLVGPLCDAVAGECDPPAWMLADPGLGWDYQHCVMMDLDYDDDVDLRDFARLQLIFESTVGGD